MLSNTKFGDFERVPKKHSRVQSPGFNEKKGHVSVFPKFLPSSVLYFIVIFRRRARFKPANLGS
jgi:hypothetical protein